MPKCHLVSPQFLWILLAHLGCAGGVDVRRGRLRPTAQHKAVLRANLLQTGHNILHGVGPDFLGDAGASTDTAEIAESPQRALPVAMDIAVLEHPAGGSSESLVAVAKSAEPVANPRSPEHVMHLLTTEEAGAHDLVSVRLEHALADANHVMTLFASGVAAGARVAVENVVPSEAVSWLTAVDAANQSADAANQSAEAGPLSAASPAGAMTFFSGAARANATSRKVLREAKPSSMMALAIARAAKAAVNVNTGRMDATGAHVDVLAPKQGLSTVEEQRRALMISEQLREKQLAEAVQAQELERQRALEEAMDRTRDAGAWGI